MKIEQKKGTSLLMVIVVTTILLLLSIMVIFVTNGTIGITNSIDKDKEYFWEAESGLNIGLKTLKTYIVTCKLDTKKKVNVYRFFYYIGYK